jgi:hypothetical protein
MVDIRREASPSGESTPDVGAVTDPNPGERSASDDLANVRPYSLGVVPASGNKAGGGQDIDTGAKVGVMRNLEFTAGGRAHRMSVGTHSPARPHLDPKTGRIHTSTASDTGDPSVGGRSRPVGEPTMAPEVEGVGGKNDTTTGDISPERRRDKHTP